ncbi:MAG TPA: hypothetical protein VIM65_05490 [Cyclobacteriaceae bacterium]
MKGKKGLFLFLALLLPICVFLFLKIFGKNEFAVKSLYQVKAPDAISDCVIPAIPYHIPDSVISQLNFASDSLLLIWYATNESDITKPKAKVTEKYNMLNQHVLSPTGKFKTWKDCVFFMQSPYDIVLLNKKGLIRGEYKSYDRDEMDRLFIELDIILKRY